MHIDSSKLRQAQGKLHMLPANDRISKFTHVAFFDRATTLNGAAFLREVIAAFPYRIHTGLTDNGMAFAEQPRYRGGLTDMFCGGHIFERVSRVHGIEHRLTQPDLPWSKGQVEHMNRETQDATSKAFHPPAFETLKAQVLASVSPLSTSLST